MGPLSWIVVGLVAGWLAQRAVGVRGRGCLTTIALGIAGGLLGGIVFKAAGDEGITDFSLKSVIVAFVGACVLLLVLGGVFRRR